MSCPKCNRNMKTANFEAWQGRVKFKILYCPNCKYRQTPDTSNIMAFSGKAMRGINKTNGQTRIKVNYPNTFDKDLIIQTLPSYVTTTPSEWRYGKRGFYKTKGRTAKVYPELTRGDTIHVAGIYQEGFPLLTTILHNSKIGTTSIFIEEKLETQVGLFYTLTIPNPILEKSYQLLEPLL